MPLISTLGAMSSRGFGEFAQQTAANYIEDVFSTYLYTGNGSTQTITNGIDLSGKGGMVWLKSRSITADHALYDTARGATFDLASNTTAAQTTQSTGLTSFTSSGFTIGSLAKINTSASTNVSWTFKKQPKFFDVVTYTGTGVATTISHNLGSVPGMIIVKQLNTARSWQVYHRSIGSGAYIILNSTSAQIANPTRWNNTNPTSTVFSVGADTSVNELNGTYVAYLFAHNAGGFGADGSQNVISCGSFTTSNGFVNLGFEPQFFLYKNSTDISDWIIADNMRGWNTSDGSSTNGFGLNANTNGGEYSWYLPSPSATGVTPFVAGTYIYMAIRRGPMRTPTSATNVFQPIYDATSLANKTNGTVGPVDMTWQGEPTGNFPVYWLTAFERLIGSKYLVTSQNYAEAAGSVSFDTNVGVKNGTWFSNGGICYNFGRAPGFFDVVCYTGTGGLLSLNHNLGVVPELVILKARGTNSYSPSNEWFVYNNKVTGTVTNQYLLLNSTAAISTNTNVFGNTPFTSTTFGAGGIAQMDAGVNAVAYLFATCPNVSKVGSYTGTGATQTISCGFTGGARFVMIKRTDTTGDWYAWDTARGMVAGTDYYLLVNSSVAQVNSNSVYTTTGGFQIVSTAAGINASGGNYIYLAIA